MAQVQLCSGLSSREMAVGEGMKPRRLPLLP